MTDRCFSAPFGGVNALIAVNGMCSNNSNLVNLVHAVETTVDA